MDNPIFVNEAGVKWWNDPSVNRYIKSKETIKDLVGYIVELPSGEKTRVLVSNGSVIYESTNLEAIGVRIDLIAFDESCDKRS